MENNFNFTTLSISDQFNSIYGFKIGSIYNKNLAIRNLTLMRNIGKYKMYNIPLFPEIGMLYNVYERQLNRPVQHYDKGGLLEWNNDVASYIADPSYANNHSMLFSVTTDDDVEKQFFSTNSGSVGISGGSGLLKRVKEGFNEFLQTSGETHYLPEIYNIDSYDDGAVSFRNYKQHYKIPGLNLVDVATNQRIDDYNPSPENTYLTYEERNVSGGAFDEDRTDVTAYDKNVDLINGKEVFKSSLLNKTNELFKNRKIESIIDRYFTDADGEVNYSRGRNLRKAEYSYSDSFVTPYCRVWTIHDNYCKVKHLIRPFEDDNGKSLTVEQVQAAYGRGFRPFTAKQLSNMTVLESRSGFVNIAPYHDDNYNLVEDSVKRCMFSIENLAWKDIEAYQRTSTGKFDMTKPNLVNRNDNDIYGPVLSKQQTGPNGGRIMWFPPYNIKFSENINTQWNDNSFIGRGEKIYTYVNTERSGTLSFTLLIDHPSVVDKWSKQNRSKYDNDVQEKQRYEEKVLRFFAGCGDLSDEEDDNTDQKKEEANDKNPESEKKTTPRIVAEPEIIKIPVFYPNYYTGHDDSPELGSVSNFVKYMFFGKGVHETEGNKGYEMTNSGTKLKTSIPRKARKDGKVWWYAIDDVYRDRVLDAENYFDRRGFCLNETIDETKLKVVFTGDTFDFTKVEGSENDYLYTYSFHDLYSVFNGGKDTNAVRRLRKILIEDKSKIIKVAIHGAASYDGEVWTHTTKENTEGQSINQTLSKNRCISPDKWLRQEMSSRGLYLPEESEYIPLVMDIPTEFDVSSLVAKLTRYAIIELHIQPKENTLEEAAEIVKSEPQKETFSTSKVVTDLHYDDEYVYFEHLKEEDNFLHNKIVDKVKYFDPAYHSITPEGFNARLTFLNQCTRQGPTIKNGMSGMGAGNLAFGRAPYCVLRIGDFYNTKICIDSITINYDNGGGVQWDLNPEGAGVQPMYADVSINFRFIGGSDLSGPIEKLQNAVSFNYYSNTSVYDRRSDYRKNFVSYSDSDDERRKAVLSWEAPVNDPNGTKTTGDTSTNENKEQKN